MIFCKKIERNNMVFRCLRRAFILDISRQSRGNNPKDRTPPVNNNKWRLRAPSKRKTSNITQPQESSDSTNRSVPTLNRIPTTQTEKKTPKSKSTPPKKTMVLKRPSPQKSKDENKDKTPYKPLGTEEENQPLLPNTLKKSYDFQSITPKAPPIKAYPIPKELLNTAGYMVLPRNNHATTPKNKGNGKLKSPKKLKKKAKEKAVNNTPQVPSNSEHLLSITLDPVIGIAPSSNQVLRVSNKIPKNNITQQTPSPENKEYNSFISSQYYKDNFAQRRTDIVLKREELAKRREILEKNKK